MKLPAKKLWIPAAIVLGVLALGGGIWFLTDSGSGDPVSVFEFYNVGMAEYWADTQECSGPVSTDKIQTVFLSETQTVTQIAVQEGDMVKKGDLLISFDTELSDLALERKRLALEKSRLQLEDAQAELAEIQNMRPMSHVVIETDTPYQNIGGIFLPDDLTYRSHDGSTQSNPIICWVPQGTNLDNSLFLKIQKQVQVYQDYNRIHPTEEEGSEETAEPDFNIDTTPVHVSDFFCIIKSTEGDNLYGSATVFQGFYWNEGGSLQLFNAQYLEDYLVFGDTGPSEEIDYGSGLTAEEISKKRQAKEKEIRDLMYAVQTAENAYKLAQAEMSDGHIYAEVDGKVVSLLTPEDAKERMQPVIKVSGGGGFYIRGSIGELDRESLQIGQEVTIQDWNNGSSYTGTIHSMGDFPLADSGYFNGNPNSSLYPFTVFVDETADLCAGNYVSIQYSADGDTRGVYLENPFLLTSEEGSFVYVQGADGRLEKRQVVTGKTVWGMYTQILTGLSTEDQIAFPYGKQVRPGAKTKIGSISSLYG